MMKYIIILALSSLFAICNQSSKIEVTNKATATSVKPGYYISADDSTFFYKGNKYLIITSEAFDEKGNLIRAAIVGDVGYSIYNQQDFIKYKNLINEYALTKLISVELIDSHAISINGQKIIPMNLNRTQKQVYYNNKSKDTLYRITYR